MVQKTNNKNNNNSIGLKCLAGGIGCGISGFVTNPMDVIKIKNQQFGGTKYGTFTGTAVALYNGEGIKGFFKGASASVLRELTYSSFRMGMYEPIKDTIAYTFHESSDSPLVKWSSAFVSGAIGSALFNPIDLVKVRFQSQLPGQPKPYTSLVNAFTTIYAEEGRWEGLYNGTGPTVIRAAFLTCAQLGSYDIIKNNLLVQTFHFDRDDISTHFASSMIASIITTTAANPADVVKTRVMNDRRILTRTTATTSNNSIINVNNNGSSSGNIVIGESSSSKRGGVFATATNSNNSMFHNNKSIIHFNSIVKNEGIMTFMKGWTASYLRIGPHTVISLMVIERVRQLLGMETY